MRKLYTLATALLAGFCAPAQWTTNTSVNTEVSNTAAGDCQSAATSDGKTWLAWFKAVPSPNNYEMRAQLIDKDGVRLLGPEGVLVNSAPQPTFTTIFSIAVDNDNNLITGFANSSTNVIYVNKTNASGAQVWSSSVSFTNGLLPKFCILGNNDIIVSWLTTTGTLAPMQRLSAATGATVWTSPINVQPLNAAHRTTPGHILPLSGNNFLYVFHNRTSAIGTASTLWVQRYDAAGTAQWAAPVQLCNVTTSYNRLYWPEMHNDTLYLGYTGATGLRTDAFVQRVNPNGTLPWGINGSDLATDAANYEFSAQIALDPSSGFVWASAQVALGANQSFTGSYVQKFAMATGARQFTDNGKAIYPLATPVYVIPGGISLFSDNLPVLLLGRYNSAVSQFLYAAKLDASGNFVWPGDTVALARFPATKSRLQLTKVVNNQAVATWVERKGTADLPYAQNILSNGTTGLVAPVAGFTSVTAVKACRGIPVQFNSTSTGVVSSYAWNFPGGSPATSTDANPVVIYNTNGTYAVSLTVSNAAGSNTASQANGVNVVGITANAGPDQIIVAGDDVQLQGSTDVNPATIAWTPATTLTNANTLTPTARPTATTAYTLSVTSSDNCVSTDNVVITVVPNCVKPMNAFTPNGDGINDRWLVTNGTACITQITAAVFNRYGGPVYKNDNYQNNWDGTYNGKPVADGTYYYAITYRLVNGKAVTLKGDVTILR